MSAAEIRTAWALVFADSQITAITPNAFNYDVLADFESEDADLYYDDILKFFSFVVLPSFIVEGNTQTSVYSVAIDYYQEVDQTGAAYNAIVDAFELLHSRMQAVIGSRWNNTVDHFRAQPQPLGRPQKITLDTESQALFSRFIYTAFKTV